MYVTGNSAKENSEFDFLTVKYDSKGNEIWTARFSRSANSSDKAIILSLDEAGNIYVDRHLTTS